MPSESPSSSLSFWRLSALRLRASALSASVALAICVDVIALQSPPNHFGFLHFLPLLEHTS